MTWAGIPSQYSAPTGAPLKAPDGTGWSTPWIWLVTLLPAVSLVISLMVPWQSMMDFDLDLTDPRASLAAMYGSFGALLSPVSWLVGIVNWGIQALCIYLAYRDYKQLLEMGVPKPFHWVWAVLGSVYRSADPSLPFGAPGTVGHLSGPRLVYCSLAWLCRSSSRSK